MWILILSIVIIFVLGVLLGNWITLKKDSEEQAKLFIDDFDRDIQVYVELPDENYLKNLHNNDVVYFKVCRRKRNNV